jgi:hypothetical protein
LRRKSAAIGPWSNICCNRRSGRSFAGSPRPGLIAASMAASSVPASSGLRRYALAPAARQHAGFVVAGDYDGRQPRAGAHDPPVQIETAGARLPLRVTPCHPARLRRTSAVRREAEAAASRADVGARRSACSRKAAALPGGPEWPGVAMSGHHELASASPSSLLRRGWRSNRKGGPKTAPSTVMVALRSSADLPSSWSPARRTCRLAYKQGPGEPGGSARLVWRGRGGSGQAGGGGFSAAGKGSLIYRC